MSYFYWNYRIERVFCSQKWTGFIKIKMNFNYFVVSGVFMSNGFSFIQVMNPYFSPRQLSIIQKITIGIAGAGGIGSNCAVMLVRSGFTRFVIADFDRVSAPNLNRQAYTTEHINRAKVECLKEVCIAINPDVAMSIHPIRIDETNVTELFNGCDAVIEAFDDAAAKALLFSRLLHSGKLLVGVSGIAGIGESDRIVIREVRKNCYIVGDNVTGVGNINKPYAPRVTVAAAKMADIVLSWVLSRAGLLEVVS